jgi:DNA-binding CsgD family transcriptional regulator
VDAGFWLGRTLMLLGELEEAETIVRETTEVARRIGDVPRARHRAAQLEAGLEIERGRVTQGVSLLEHEISRVANEHPRIVLHGDRAVWAARLGRTASAESVRVHIDAGEASARSASCPRCTGEFLLLAAEALARVGSRDAARQALDRRDALDIPLEDLDRVIRRHVTALSVEEPAARATALEATLAAAEMSPYRLATLWIRLDLGRTLATLSDGRAVAELERTAADARERGAITVRELAEGSLRALGVRTWRRGAAGAPLTAREEEVARLVAAGATNREVASALFLSPKTVERHLVNLFRKLDVRNRTELAAHLGEADPKRAGIPR